MYSIFSKDCLPNTVFQSNLYGYEWDSHKTMLIHVYGGIQTDGHKKLGTWNVGGKARNWNMKLINVLCQAYSRTFMNHYGFYIELS